MVVTPEEVRRRSMGQILLLAAGFLVLVSICAPAVILVDQARQDSGWVVHTVEVENQISTLLLEIRRAEGGARGYLLTSEPRFLAEYNAAVAGVLADADRLSKRASDNPVQIENNKRLRPAILARLAELEKIIDLVKRNDAAGALALLRQAGADDSVARIDDVAEAMRAEENELFALRTATADRTERLASIVTVVGSGLVVALAAISIFLVRRSADARDKAEAQLRDNNLNLESTVDERTADLREANDEIQRFAYIVSHELRSPLVNIMGFTSELEAAAKTVGRFVNDRIRRPDNDVPAEVVEAIGEDVPEAFRFIKTSTAKMDGLIGAILKLSREGRRVLTPEPLPMRSVVENIIATLKHRVDEKGAEIIVLPLPNLTADRLAVEQ